jgi:hypothetical protein
VNYGTEKPFMKLLTCFLITLLLACSCSLLGGEVAINNNSTVVYKRGTTKKQATQLGQFLLEQGYFNEHDQRKVQLHEKADTLIITFFIPKHLLMEDHENLNAGFIIWQQWIQEQVFTNKPSRIELSDEQQQITYTIDTTAR